MNIKLLALIITLMLPSTGFTKENAYVIDQSHFSLGFLVEHAGYAKTLGMFRHIEGSFNHDDEKNKITNVIINVNTESVYTNHDERDSHLRGPDFLNVEKFPKMTFTVDNVEITDNETLISGKLTLLGITKDINLTGKINKIAKYPFGFSPPVVIADPEFWPISVLFAAAPCNKTPAFWPTAVLLAPALREAASKYKRLFQPTAVL